MLYNDDRLTFQILTLTRFSHTDGFFQVKQRPYGALSYRLSGQGTFYWGDSTFTSRAGDLLFIPEGVSYQVAYENSRILLIHLSDCNYKNVENITLNNPGYFQALFQQLVEDWEQGADVNRAKSQIYRLLQKLREDQAPEKALQKCLDYLQKNYHRADLRLSDICREGNMSEATLNRRFAKFYGISPKQYLIKLRLTAALELLAGQDMSVKEIAYACGFRDEKYFSRLLKSHYHRPPSDFRKLI